VNRTDIDSRHTMREVASGADKLRIFGFAGSLRKGSFNKALMRASAELLPANVKLEMFDLEGIPPFNAGLEQKMPASVRNFKAGVKAADALLIATPEYNYSMPGVLKNTIDWGSCPYGDNCFDDKPVAIMGASGGMIGTSRAQYPPSAVLRILEHAPPEPARGNGSLCRGQVR
jgi:chromate reductase